MPWAELADQGLDLDLLIAGAGGLAAGTREPCGRVGHNRAGHLLGFRGSQQETEPHEYLVGSRTHITEGRMGHYRCGSRSMRHSIRGPVDSPGLREAIVDRQTGLLVPHGDVSALCEAIRRLVTDSAIAEAIGGGSPSACRVTLLGQCEYRRGTDSRRGGLGERAFLKINRMGWRHGYRSSTNAAICPVRGMCHWMDVIFSRLYCRVARFGGN